MLSLTLGAGALAQQGSKPPQADPQIARQAEAARGALFARHGEKETARVERGVRQVAALWRTEDGDLAAFAQEHFLPQGPELEQTRARFATILEQLDGHFVEIGRELRRATEVEVGPILRMDPLVSAWDPSAHLNEDLFRSKIAFIALLNFPQDALADRLAQGDSWSRQRWAESRLTGRFSRRIPAEIQAAIAEEGSRADLYIARYNIWMHHLLDEQGRRLFPSGKRLITHWNLRDELKANYANKAQGLARQRMILQVMDRIVTQTIPQAVIDNPRLDWNPFTNAVAVAPEDTVEKDAPEREARAEATREPDTRYARILANFRAQRRADPYSPLAPTAIARSFELFREIPEERVVSLLKAVLESPLVPRVAKEIESSLGRPLEAHDIWFNGFRGGGGIPEERLDAMTRKRYPNAEAFTRDMPRILRGLGFSPARAKWLSQHIVVDASRGAGHALGAARRGDYPRLRTRIEKEGMNYKGYNIAIHELGHNVEQAFSLYEVDNTLMQGVPNTAFTEALAFVFQSRDTRLLGLPGPDKEAQRLRVLNEFWQTWEIAGVALVDIAMWHWMYAHPEATPAQLRAAVEQIARDTWNRYYQPVLGSPDSVLLGIYSHMVTNPIYLCDYPLGHLIAFQIEEHLATKGPLGKEFERMTRHGAVTPDQWMVHATGAPISAEPLLRATQAALDRK